MYDSDVTERAGYCCTNAFDTIYSTEKTRHERTTNRELLTQLIRKNNEPSRMLLPSVPPPENQVTTIAPAVATSTPMILRVLRFSMRRRIVITTVIMGWVVSL